MLLAIDQINALFSKTEYFGIDGKRLTPDSLVSILALRQFFDSSSLFAPPSPKFLSVGATSFSDPRIFRSELGHSNPSLARCDGKIYERIEHPQLNTISHEKKNFSIHKVPLLTRAESLSMIKLYRSVGLIYEGENREYLCTPILMCHFCVSLDFIDEEYLEKKYLASGGNAARLYEACSYDNIYE